MLSALDKLYWVRISLGVVAGLVSDFVFHADYGNAISVAILIYLGSYYIARYLWFKKVAPPDASKIYTTGLFGFVMFFIFVWILLFTLVS
jgi:hypothetical protein